MPNTGRRLNHDPESRRYAAPRLLTAPTKSWLHTSSAPVLDQNGYNGCTGWAGGQLLNHSAYATARRKFNDAVRHISSPKTLGNDQCLFLYERATEADDFPETYPPSDTGSSGLGVAKALQKLGVIDRYEWTFDFGQAFAYAAQQPVLLGTIWSEPMFVPDESGIISVGTATDLQNANSHGMGHEYLWRGARRDWRRGRSTQWLVRIRNSWSPQWGLHGDAYIPAEELEHLIIDWHGDVCVPGR